MRRSNRLILLIGVLLAVVSFVAIVYMFGTNGRDTGQATPSAPPGVDTLVTTVAVPLGTQLRPEMLAVVKVAEADRAPDAFGDPSRVLGQVVRTDVVAGAQVTASMFATSGLGQSPASLLAKGMRAISVLVDQVSGVGTLISVGDRVDAVVGFGAGTCGAAGYAALDTRSTASAKPSATPSAAPSVKPALPSAKPSLPPAMLQAPNDNGVDPTVKLLIQDVRVVGTLLPPTGVGDTVNSLTGGGTAFNADAKEIAILAVSAQQAEVIKYAQMNGCISLVLRSPQDFVDAAGAPVEPSNDPTTGIILKTLVNAYGVLPPEVVPMPTPSPTH